MKELIGKEDYVNALKLAEAILGDLQKTESKDNGLLIVLGVATVTVLGGIAFYIMKQKGVGGIKFGEKKEKVLRKLEKTED